MHEGAEFGRVVFGARESGHPGGEHVDRRPGGGCAGHLGELRQQRHVGAHAGEHPIDRLGTGARDAHLDPRLAGVERERDGVVGHRSSVVHSR